MARVHYVKKARKDNPAVKAGEPYFWWKFRYGPKHYSKERPRPSQLTQSSGYHGFAAAREIVEDLDSSAGIDEILSVLESAASDIEEVGQEYEDGANSIRDYFPNSDTADESEEKAYACTVVAENIQSAIDELQGLEEADEKEIDNILSGIDFSDFHWY